MALSPTRGARLDSPRKLRRASQVPLLKPLKNVQTMDRKERNFLDAAEKGDKPTIQQFIDDADVINLNVNCTDVMGRTALEIAVDNENFEIVEVLLHSPSIQIGNALLYAVREGVYKIVEMLIDHPSITAEMLGCEGYQDSLRGTKDAENYEYSADISPVVLAAHLNQFEILQLLLTRGATIHKPHSLSCSCQTCQEERLSDSLKHSLRRIYTYRALASPAWISLTSNDPILTSFKLSWELQKLSRRECEFKEVYWRLNEQCKSYACDLMSQCRSTEEVIAVLNKDVCSDDPDDIWGAKLSLSRLKLAIKYEQKQFVAHPHCQQLLTSIWYEGFPGRQERGSVMNIFVCILLMLLWPVLSSCYIFLPKSRIGRIVRSPFMKFLYYSTSFACFLLLLTMATYRQWAYDKTRASERGPQPTILEAFITVWVFGMVWSEVKQLWEEGFKKYIHQWWNWLDFIMVSLYITTFTLRLVAYYIVRTGDHGPFRLARIHWVSNEPMLISESLFAVANVFSFARIIYLFQTNPYLGPLQISLGCMLLDIAKFFFIFFLVLTSFAIGLAQLYWYYSPQVDLCEVGQVCGQNSMAFSSIANSYTTLMWSLFSISSVTATDIVEDHFFTQLVGSGLYIGYHVTSIIVLLNMLIAMMSHSFQTINDHADLEWKFHRTKLWMSHFDEGSSLPAPFNIIITPKAIWYFLKGCYSVCLWCRGRYKWETRKKRPTIKRPGYNKQKQKLSECSPQKTPERITYQDIMRRLVSRYIHQIKKDMKLDRVNEDDLLEIKQDISSLRYELRDDRNKEIDRSSRHIDGVKKEILRTLSCAGGVQRKMPNRKPPMAKLSSQSTVDTEEDDNDNDQVFSNGNAGQSQFKFLSSTNSKSQSDSKSYQQLESMKKDIIENLNVLFKAQREELKEILNNVETQKSREHDVVLVCTDC